MDTEALLDEGTEIDYLQKTDALRLGDEPMVVSGGILALILRSLNSRF